MGEPHALAGVRREREVGAGLPSSTKTPPPSTPPPHHPPPLSVPPPPLSRPPLPLPQEPSPPLPPPPQTPHRIPPPPTKIPPYPDPPFPSLPNVPFLQGRVSPMLAAHRVVAFAVLGATALGAVWGGVIYLRHGERGRLSSTCWLWCKPCSWRRSVSAWCSCPTTGARPTTPLRLRLAGSRGRPRSVALRADRTAPAAGLVLGRVSPGRRWQCAPTRQPDAPLLRRHEPARARLSDHRADRPGDRAPQPAEHGQLALPDRVDRLPARDRVLHLSDLARAARRDLRLAGTGAVRLLRRRGPDRARDPRLHLRAPVGPRGARLPAHDRAFRNRDVARLEGPAHVRVLGLDAGVRPVEGVQCFADLHVPPDEDRRVALRVAARLALAQRQHEIHEVGGLLAFEGGHELLIVDSERVRRVVRDRFELGPDPHVLVHRPLPVVVRERVPRTRLHERVDDEVRRVAGHDLPRLPRRGVLRGLRRRQVRVGSVEPAGEGGAVQVGA